MSKNNDCIAIYSRKSKFTGKGESIDNQIELCKDYICSHFGEQALEHVLVFEDEGFSGGNVNRPDFKRMIQAAKQHKINFIIVYRLDRISRNVSDFSNLIEELNQLNISFISIREQFDTSTPMGRAMMYIASVFSQLERETIAERIRDNMHELAKTGRWLGGTTPIGYLSESQKKITIDGKINISCHLKLIPKEAELVKTIFYLYQETNSLYTTVAELMNRKAKTRTGKYFSRFAVRSILQNPVYLIADQDAYHYFLSQDSELYADSEQFDKKHGILAYNRTKQTGKTTIFNPPTDWIISIGQHVGIIPSNQWIQVQKSLEQNKSKTYRRPRKNKALLTGLIFCKCGSRMYAKVSGRKNADREILFSYVCKVKSDSKKSVCNNNNANGNSLDLAVIEEIKKIQENKEYFIAQLEKSRKLFASNQKQYDEQLQKLKKEYNQNEKKIENLVNSLIDAENSVVKKHITKRIEDLHIENEEINKQINKLLNHLSQNISSDIEFNMMQQRLCVFSQTIDTMSIAQKRNAIQSIISKIIWDGKFAHIFFFEDSNQNKIKYPDISDLMVKDLPKAEVSSDSELAYTKESKTLLCEDSK